MYSKREKKFQFLLIRLEGLKERRNELESLNSELKQERKQENYRDIELEMIMNEESILILEEEIAIFKLSADVWAYTIMGNRKAVNIYSDYQNIILEHVTPKEHELGVLSLPFIREVINFRCFGEILRATSKYESRLAFQVLGVLLMRYGAKMPNNLKKLILLHSRWEDEEGQIKNITDKQSRYKFLSEFREKIIKYKEGEISEVSVIHITEILEEKIRGRDFSLIDKQPVDYSLHFKEKF